MDVTKREDSVRSDLPRNFGTERKYGKIKQEEANRIHTCEEIEMMQQSCTLL